MQRNAIRTDTKPIELRGRMVTLCRTVLGCVHDPRITRVHNFYKPDSPLPWDKEFRPKNAVVEAIRDALLHGEG